MLVKKNELVANTIGLEWPRLEINIWGDVGNIEPTLGLC